MNDAEFQNSFVLVEYSYQRAYRHDASHGSLSHYLGRIIEGHGCIITETERLELEEGDFFYIPKGCRYRSAWGGGEPVRFDSLGFRYLPVSGRAPYRLQKLNCTDEAVEIYRELSARKGNDPLSVGLLYTFFGLVQPSMQSEPLSQPDMLLEKAIGQMRLNPLVRMTDVARACDISPATLYLLFRKKLNTTPNAVRQQMNCEKAAELLTTTDLSVEEISTRLGFSSSSYFRKIFKACMNKTPREWRAEHSGIKS